MTPYLFVFGTLRDPELLALVSGIEDLHSTGQAATAPGWQVLRAKDQVYPAIRPVEEGTATGLLLPNVPPEAMARLNFFEEAFGFTLHQTPVSTGQETVDAAIYLPEAQSDATDGPWMLDRWQQEGRPLFLEVAAEVMSVYAHQTADNMPVNATAILSRAYSRVNAKKTSKQTGIRHSYTTSDVEVRSLTRPFSKFFAVEEYKLTHPKFAGGDSENLRREVFAAADAITVLPYDPALDKVVLIEQFRMGPFARGDQRPWLLEAVAGRIEVGQTPEDTARREVQEEAGLILSRLELISDFYPTPGAYSEYIYSYIGQADLSGFEPGVHGLDTEHEDIATHLVAADDLMPMLASGQINNSPLVISVLWLTLNRDRLQKDWTGA